MKEIILDTLQESIKVKDRFIKNNIDLIQRGADMLLACITSGHKIMIFPGEIPPKGVCIAEFHWASRAKKLNAGLIK